MACLGALSADVLAYLLEFVPRRRRLRSVNRRWLRACWSGTAWQRGGPTLRLWPAPAWLSAADQVGPCPADAELRVRDKTPENVGKTVDYFVTYLTRFGLG